MKEKILIHNIYAPKEKTERKEFYKDLRDEINKTEGRIKRKEYQIIAGDFICVLDKEIDTVHGKDYHEVGSKELEQWMEKQEIIDPWRILNPETREYTSPRREARIDRVLISKKIFEKKEVQVNMINVDGADHIGMEIEIRNMEEELQKAPWRLQKWVMDTKEFTEKMGKRIKSLHKEIVKEEDEDEDEGNKKNLGTIERYE